MPPFALSDEDAAKVAEEYARGVTRGEIAARYGVHPNTVTRTVRRLGVVQRRARASRLSDHAIMRVTELYVAGVPTTAIATEVGASSQLVSRVAIAAGANPRRPYRSPSARALDAADIATMAEAYRSGATARELAKAYGVTHPTVLRHLARRDVPRRDQHVR